ncbi:Dabb family protein [Flagellimonas sp. DF-77]|uniref:Dabb family protein n=1 Tax=Flagellimonas algarum TaxID=3230298 RepID=UPI003394A1FC
MRLLCTSIFTLLLMTSAMAQTDPASEFDASFVHSVYFWLKHPDSKADRAAFEKSLRTFLDNSEFAKTDFIGTPPKATREVVDGSFTYNLIVTFASAADQEGYQKEAAHLKFIEESQHLWTKVIVYDAIGTER